MHRARLIAQAKSRAAIVMHNRDVRLDRMVLYVSRGAQALASASLVYGTWVFGIAHIPVTLTVCSIVGAATVSINRNLSRKKYTLGNVMCSLPGIILPAPDISLIDTEEAPSKLDDLQTIHYFYLILIADSANRGLKSDSVDRADE